MAKRKPLNVKSHLEHVITSTQYMLDNNYKDGPNGLCMPPAYVDDLRIINFIARAILRKHAKKNTRKDIYVEAE